MSFTRSWLKALKARPDSFTNMPSLFFTSVVVSCGALRSRCSLGDRCIGGVFRVTILCARAHPQPAPFGIGCRHCWHLSAPLSAALKVCPYRRNPTEDHRVEGLRESTLLRVLSTKHATTTNRGMISSMEPRRTLSQNIYLHNPHSRLARPTPRNIRIFYVIPYGFPNKFARGMNRIYGLTNASLSGRFRWLFHDVGGGGHARGAT